MRSPLRTLRKAFFLTTALALGSPLLATGQGISPGSPLPTPNQPMSNATGGQGSLAEVKGEAGLVVILWSNQCPWVDRYEERVAELASAYMAEGFGFALVNANDADAFPLESPEESQQRARGRGYEMPYFADEGSRLARALGAERTPEAYVFDANDNLVYAGAIDDSPSDPRGVEEAYLQNALDAVLAGEAVETAQTKAFGCTIKLQEATG